MVNVTYFVATLLSAASLAVAADKAVYAHFMVGH